MRASSGRFARALAERIREILPPSLAVHADGDRLTVYAKGVSQGGSAAAVIVQAEGDRTLRERVECAAVAVLGGIQDSVSEYLALPWPGDADGGMAMPAARMDAERVHLWFGSREAAPAVTLRPIGLDEFVERVITHREIGITSGG